ncbi:PhzF family phenazine biosynthesis protein [Maricurvus nonylphenolicus]|uniref:PhzF family phenazine biosynthesis protein n=1 Tax=Maricurvus nonylphenolicus TaxID=1008307 RepID=UPI0036F243F8
MAVIQPRSVSNNIENKLDLQVFADHGYSGNDVQVILLNHMPEQHEWKTLIRLSADTDSHGNPQTLCFIVLQDEPVCRWYQGGREINLCGSALIAAAYSLHHHASYTLPIKIHGPSQIFTLQDANGEYGFSLPRFTLFDEPLPAAAKRWLNKTPVNCMSSGDPQGYWVVEFEESVTELQPQLQTICETTQRAIIATSLQAPSGFDYELRYFAPQYGIDEDIATGSANAVLACYWQQWLKQDEFQALQRSGLANGKGGSIRTRLDPQTVSIFGKVIAN